jgi:hypothetical protein
VCLSRKVRATGVERLLIRTTHWSLRAPQRDLPAHGHRNAANDNGDEEEEELEDEDGEGTAAIFPLPAGFDINKIITFD